MDYILSKKEWCELTRWLPGHLVALCALFTFKAGKVGAQFSRILATFAGAAEILSLLEMPLPLSCSVQGVSVAVVQWLSFLQVHHGS